jgi:homocysteine S-methyltransferase
VRPIPTRILELTPPQDPDLGPLLEAARRARDAGIDAISVPDSPWATPRVSALVTSTLVQREVGITAIPHVRARDRNAIAHRADLLGAAAAGIPLLMVVAGDDPAERGPHPDASSVRDVDPPGLLSLAASLDSFALGACIDPLANDLAAERASFERKRAAGASFAVTQPIDSPDALDALGDLGVPIIAGAPRVLDPDLDHIALLTALAARAHGVLVSTVPAIAAAAIEQLMRA